ncbi:MAG: mechanosensitive ion channel family protein [Planctomycetota bacterium]|jgi:small-conductance mechanosensitive channel
MRTPTAIASLLAAAVESGPPESGGLSWLAWDRWLPAVLIAIVGGAVLAVLSRWAGKAVGKRWSAGRGAVVRKTLFYAGWVVLILAVLNQLGFKLTAVLGAAGIAGIAVGFAAQTSLSNVISGVFLLTEKPFKAGDMIQIGDTMGICLSVDLLSVKLRTFDNKFVRIPNESLIKTQVTNYSRFPIRRVDLLIGVAYKEDVERVKALLLEIAREHPLALNEPEPLCFCWNFNTSSVDVLFVVWATGNDFLTLKDALLVNIKKRFDEEGIEIPFPHVSLYTGSATGPLPVELGPESLAAFSAGGPKARKSE